jgi:hypothetical protein
MLMDNEKWNIWSTSGLKCEFATKKLINLHMKRHASKKKFKCHSYGCSMSFKTKSEMESSVMFIGTRNHFNASYAGNDLGVKIIWRIIKFKNTKYCEEILITVHEIQKKIWYECRERGKKFSTFDYIFELLMTSG